MTERMTLYEIIETLEERDKRLITLRYFQGKTQTETAEQLDMTQVQVSRREKKAAAYDEGYVQSIKNLCRRTSRGRGF